MRKLLTIFLLLAGSAQAASEFPPSYRWRTITTEHFYVHFHQGEDELARRAAGIAESVHERLVPIMRWTPADRTHLILADNVDVSNGSATPFPNNRIEVYVSAPGGDPSSPLAYYDDWLDLVITHEYAHILHLDQAHSLPATLRRIFGRNPFGFPNAYAPLWMIEGTATFVESELTDAGRVKGTFEDMVLRMAAVEGRWPTEAQASGLTAYWPGGSARYFFGSKFINWLARKHGTDALAKYFELYSGRIVFNVNTSARKAFGASITDLWEEWTREEEAAYRAEVDRLRAAGLTPTQRLTRLGYETQHPAVSPDGTRIAYAHRGPFERPAIRVWDVAGGRDVDTHQVHTTSPLSWSPDGTTIAYSDLEYAGSYSILSDIYLWRVGDRRARRITTGARLKDPAFTPDGRTLVAVENRAGRNRLVEIDVATGVIRALVTPADDTQFSEPQVSGASIVVAEWKEGRIDLVTYSRRGERIANLTSSLARSINAAPRFTADGSAIVFTSDVSGIANIHSVPSGGGPIRRLTNVAGGAFFPTTRDGKTIWFSEYHGEGFDLARAEGGADLPLELRAPPAQVPRSARDDMQGAVDKPYTPRSSIFPRYWTPLFDSSGIGVATSGADVLGFHQYAAAVTNEYQSLVYSYDRLHPTLTVAAVRYEDDVLSFRTSPNDIVTYTETVQRLLAQVSAPLLRYDRQAFGYVAVIRDHITGDAPPGVSDFDLDRAGAFRGTLQGVRLGAAFNNARTHGFSISPENGITARFDYENLSQNLGSDLSSQSMRADVRGFLAIPYSRSPLGRHVLAARVAGGRTTGDFILQRELRVGGEGSGELLTLGTRHFPVRGYDSSTLRGTRAAIGSLEYRVPLWQINRGPATWPFFFNRLVGDVFVDAGRAWTCGTDGRTIASAGAEIGLDLFLGYTTPLRFRVGAAYRLRDPDKGEVQPFAAIESSF